MMDRWEWFLRKDALFDLAEVENAKKVSWSKAWEQSTGVEYIWQFPHSKQDAVTWMTCVHALRSVGRRIGKLRLRHFNREPLLTPAQADDVMAAYVGLLRFELQRDGKPLKPPVRMKPLPRSEKIETFGNASLFIFQRLFASLLFRDPVCSTCGCDLPPTPTGKISTALRCQKHNREQWWNGLSPQQRRDYEADKKRKQRAKLKKGKSK